MVFVESLLGMSRDCFGFGAYIIVFFAIFLESFPFLGAFIPGGIIALFLCGLLAKLGYFVFWKVVLVAVTASVLMDIAGYMLGRNSGPNFVCKQAHIFFIKRKIMEKIGLLVREHAGKSIFFGKINPVTRSIAPFIVGNEGVKFRRFIFYSLFSSALWVLGFVLIGYVFGNSMELIRSAEAFIVWLMVIFLGGFYVYYIGNLFKEFFGSKNEVKCGDYCKK
ncbi:DedA family protein [Methanococcoides sp. SA1]|nr:DedA family protein [Methanococcoides sp. SA1]